MSTLATLLPSYVRKASTILRNCVAIPIGVRLACRIAVFAKALSYAMMLGDANSLESAASCVMRCTNNRNSSSGSRRLYSALGGRHLSVDDGPIERHLAKTTCGLDHRRAHE